MMSISRNCFLFSTIAVLSLSAAQAQQDDWDAVELRISHVAGSIYMLEGLGSAPFSCPQGPFRDTLNLLARFSRPIEIEYHLAVIIGMAER